MARRNRRHFVRLVDRLEVGSVAEAVDLIAAGLVTVNGMKVTNPGALIASDAVVALVSERPLRGTVKLRAALTRFDANVSGRVCLDAGAAAGGFTSALLEAGAAKVYAIDVGFGQLVGKLRQDPRVVNLERINLAALDRSLIPEAVAVVCLDLSYLALANALPQLSRLDLSEEAQLMALVKPAFELHASSVVIEDDLITKAVTAATAAAQLCGWSVDHRLTPVHGAGGAREIFIYAKRQPRM